jgi:SWI/SNF-related matrix-associated actin-dependent regulator of chromatin subfamily A member 5
MGLGKTFQTLAFISHLKAAGLPGPHLVVTPLAVLQNWINECRRFTPQLSIVKLHGSLADRDRLKDDVAVRTCAYDIYLTTFDMVRSEEAFFTESFLFHTVTIDEGHRLKNPACAMNRSLARIVCPFRLLLTGTPLQNHLGELCALLNYILPGVLTHEAMSKFESAACCVTGHMDRLAITQARQVLESLMIRRVKSQVETSLLPKVEFVLRAPLTSLQRHYYRALLLKEDADLVARGLMTYAQLIWKMTQLQKVCNHPKCLVYSIDRERVKASKLAAANIGSEFAQVAGNPSGESLLLEQETRQQEATLRALSGDELIASSGKLQLLDRLLVKLKAAGSRVLLFSQFTLTLDVLEEYARTRWGAIGVAFMRLDGNTNRIDRELDMRMFNAAGSSIFLYLISTRAGGLGINLATADAVVLYDSSYNPHVDLQAQDRAHRIGQTKQVHVYRIVVESSFEERVLLRARQKLMLDGLVISTTGSSSDTAIIDDNDEMNNLSIQELWSMLSFGADKVGGVFSLYVWAHPLCNGRLPIVAHEYFDIFPFLWCRYLTQQ